MSPLVLGLLFAGFLGLGFGLAHFYVWRRLVVASEPPRWLRRGLGAWLLFLVLAVPVCVFVARTTGNEVAVLLVFASFFWMAFLFYLGLIAGLWEFVRLGHRAAARVRRTPEDPGRRRFLARAAAATSAVGAASVSFGGIRSALYDLETPEVPVRLPGLPGGLSGFRLVVLSDLHLGPVLREAFVRRVCHVAGRLRADAVVVVGDLVDGSVGSLGRMVAPLAGIPSRYGIYFVPGNHDFYSGFEPWRHFLDRLGIRVLANGRVSLPGRGPSFDLAGVVDYRASLFDPRWRPDPVAAVRGRDPERALVMLAHQPIQIRQNAVVRPGLQISGHTHGGQIWPWGYAVRLTQPYLQGLHRHNGHTQVFVTRGTGCWGPPVRFLAPAEIPTIVLLPG